MLPFCYTYFQTPYQNNCFQNKFTIFPLDFNFMSHQNLLLQATSEFQKTNTNYLNSQDLSKTQESCFKTDINVKIQNSDYIPSSQKYIKKQSRSKITKNKLSKKKLIKKKPINSSVRKNKYCKKDKAYVAKQSSKQQPSINCRYIQKNFELNIINQVFSFLWTQEKSINFVKKYLNDATKVSLFYQYIKIVRKYCKRYINKQYLLDLCNFQPCHIAYKMVSKNEQKQEYFSMNEFSKCIRHLIYIYLHNLCPLAIVTSRKIRNQIWKQHLIKCRLIRNFIFYDLSKEEYEKQLINKSHQLKQVQNSTQELIYE